MKKVENNGLTDIILFSLTVVTFIIGAHQTFVNGLQKSYWIFTFSITFLLIYNYRLQKRMDKQPPQNGNQDKQAVKKPTPNKKK